MHNKKQLMIRFLQKFRQTLLKENKFRNYTLFAIGEILLVVIGILIALSLDNWNEENKNKVAELEYYCRLLDDLEIEQQLIKEAIISTNERLGLAKSILIDLHSQAKSKSELLNDFLIVNRTPVFVPRSVTFDFLIASGDIKLITDNSIYSSLTTYYDIVENIVIQMNQNRDQRIENVFGYDSYTEFGYQEFDYVNLSLGPEIIELLPNVDWTKDSESKYFKKFQDDLVFIITMNERHKQHIEIILEAMELPFNLLKNKCNIKNEG
jgi:hypothetical protein